MSDDHTLTRKVVETRVYDLDVINWDAADFNPDGREGLALHNDMDTAVYAGSEERKTLRCSCGENFRKGKTALAHLDEVGEL